MKKILLSAIATILPTLFAFSCAKPPSQLDNEDILIPNNLVSSVYQKTIANFEEYLSETYGDEQNIKYDYYTFYRMNNSDRLTIILDYFKNEFQTNKRAALQEITYRNDDITLNIISKENGVGCRTLDNSVCDTNNTIDTDENIQKIATVDFGNLVFRIYSKNSDIYSYSKELVFPVKNYWLDKKNLNTLWNDHDRMNDLGVESALMQGDYFMTKDFDKLKLQPEDDSLASTLNFITKIEDIFGDFYWDMKATSSFAYTKLVNKFNLTVPAMNKRYNLSNFYKTRPANNYCEVIDNTVSIDDTHYCGQLEQIKLKLSEVKDEDLGKYIELSFDVLLDEKYTPILTESITTFKIFFGYIIPINNDMFFYDRYQP